MNDTFRTFTWDADGNPVTIGLVSLTFDALDRMVEQSVSGTNSEIVYSPAGVKFALMNGATLTKAFVPLTGGATAVYNSSGLAYYRHTDHLGSSRFASTPTQTPYSDTAYSPFGEPYASSGAIDNSFTGQNQDTTAGLYDFLYREYDPNQARWTSPDPAGLASVNPSNPQSWNRYSYVLNNPLGLIDPSGLTCQWDDGTSDAPEDSVEGGDPTACADAGGTWVPDPSTGSTFGGDPNGSDNCVTVGGVPSGCSDTNFGQPSDAGFWSTMNAFWNLVPWSATVVEPLVDLGPNASGGVGLTVAYNPKSDKTCLGLVAGGQVPATGRSFAVGPLTLGNLDKADAVLSGWSGNFGVQSVPTIGVQSMANMSGWLAGGTLGEPGIFTGVSVSTCSEKLTWTYYDALKNFAPL